MDNAKQVNEALDKAIKGLTDRIKDRVDVAFLEEQLQPTLERLEEKRKQGTLSLRDYMDFLRIARNVLIPAAIKQQVDRLEAIKKLVEVAD